MTRYIEDLKKISRGLKMRPQSTIPDCLDTAFRVRAETGLAFREGFIVSEKDKYEHSWNYDPETNEIIDLSSDFPKIIVIPKDSETGRRYMTFAEYRASGKRLPYQ